MIVRPSFASRPQNSRGLRCYAWKSSAHEIIPFRMKLSLSGQSIDGVSKSLHTANSAFNEQYPGESDARQPIHTVYGGAHLFRADLAKRLGAVALRTLKDYAPDPAVFAGALHLGGG